MLDGKIDTDEKIKNREIFSQKLIIADDDKEPKNPDNKPKKSSGSKPKKPIFKKIKRRKNKKVKS